MNPAWQAQWTMELAIPKMTVPIEVVLLKDLVQADLECVAIVSCLLKLKTIFLLHSRLLHSWVYLWKNYIGKWNLLFKSCHTCQNMQLINQPHQRWYLPGSHFHHLKHSAWKSAKMFHLNFYAKKLPEKHFWPPEADQFSYKKIVKKISEFFQKFCRKQNWKQKSRIIFRIFWFPWEIRN